MVNYLVVDADDFGASARSNGGILKCRAHGVVTSTSLMVTGRALAEAVAMSRDPPALAAGLRRDVWGEDECGSDLDNVPAIRCRRPQLRLFRYGSGPRVGPWFPSGVPGGPGERRAASRGSSDSSAGRHFP